MIPAEERTDDSMCLTPQLSVINVSIIFCLCNVLILVHNFEVMKSCRVDNIKKKALTLSCY